MKRILLTALVACLASSVGAGQGRGAAELGLDASAVAALLERALPPSVPLGAGGAIATVTLGPVRRVVFDEPAVEATLGIRVEELAWSGEVSARLVPRVEPLSGRVELRPESLVPVTPLPVRVDLAGLVEPARLPRSLVWTVALDNGVELGLVCFVQGVRVREDRLLIELGLLVR